MPVGAVRRKRRHCLRLPPERGAGALLAAIPVEAANERGLDPDHLRAGDHPRRAGGAGLRSGPGDGEARARGLRARVRSRGGAHAELRGWSLLDDRLSWATGRAQDRASGRDGRRRGHHRLARASPWCDQARASRRRPGERRRVAVAGRFGAPRVRPPAPRARTLRLEARRGIRLSRHRCGAVRLPRARFAASRRHAVGCDRSRSLPAPRLARGLGRMDALCALDRRRRPGGDRLWQPSRRGRGGGRRPRR